MGLYKHNLIAYNKIIDAIENKKIKRMGAVQPTGTGKSFLASAVINYFGKEEVLFISASYEIIKQFKKKFNHNNCDYYIYPNLLKDGVTSQIIAKNYSLIILDEFHRVGAALWKREIFKITNNFKGIVVGFTATKYRHSKGLDGKNVDMAKELFDNNIVSELFLNDCFKLGILPYPKYIQSLYSVDKQFEQLKNKVKRSKKSKGDIQKLLLKIERKKIDWNNLSGVKEVFFKHIKKERNFILFATTVKHLKEIEGQIKEWFKNIGDGINIFKVHSYEKGSNTQLSQFIENCEKNNNEVNIMLSVSKLNEGLHVDNIDGCIFLRPTESNVIYFQQLGRCLSSKGNKPIVFDLVDNFSNQNYFEELEIITKKENKKGSGFSKKEEDEIKSEFSSYYKNLEMIDNVVSVKNFCEKIFEETDDFMINYDFLVANSKKAKNYNKLSSKAKNIISNYRSYYRSQILIHKIGDRQTSWEKNRKPLLDGLMDFGVNWLEPLREDFDEKRICSLIDEIKIKGTGGKRGNDLRSFRKRYLDGKMSVNEIKLMDKKSKGVIHFDWKKGATAFQENLFQKRKNKYFKIIENKGWESLDEKGKEWFGTLRRSCKSYKQPYTKIQLERLELYKKGEKYRIKTLGGVVNHEDDYDERLKKIFMASIKEIEQILFENKDEYIPFSKLPTKWKKWIDGKKRLINKSGELSDVLVFQLEELNKLNFGLDWRNETVQGKLWMNKYNLAYSDLKENGYDLATKETKRFLTVQRYSKKTGSLDKTFPERNILLDNLNKYLFFDWKTDV